MLKKPYLISEIFAAKNVLAAPPTAHNIEQFRREAIIGRRASWGAGALCGLASMGQIWATNEVGYAIALYAVALLLLFIAPLVLKNILNEYEEISSPGSCKAMYENCEETEAGRAYRQAVLAQGRKFIRAELQMLKDWNSLQDGIASCKKLYDIPA